MSALRLYRGEMEPLPAEGRQAFIRQDRRPRDTGKKLAFNICFNLMIERHFGVPLIRRRSLFVCGDIRRVIRFAAAPDTRHIGVVEPIGHYRFLYASNVFDSAQIADDLTERYLACFHPWQRPLCSTLLKDITLTLPKLEIFLAKHPEIDNGGFSWGATRLRDRLYDMLDGLKQSRTARTYCYTDTGLPSAIEKGVEIMLYDCPKGYHIKPIDSSELPQFKPNHPNEA